METDPIVNEEQVIDAPETVEEVIETAPVPGEKTDSALLLKSLQEERDRRRDLERELASLKESEPEPEAFSDEGQALKAEIRSIQDKLALSELTAQYPQLKDKATEFDDYRADPANRGMSVATAAKAFLVERNLLTVSEPRKGLERDTGGTRAPVKTGRTQDEIADLRKNNYRQYVKELKAGTLNA